VLQPAAKPVSYRRVLVQVEAHSYADGRADMGGTNDRSLNIKTPGLHLAQPARSQPFGARSGCV